MDTTRDRNRSQRPRPKSKASPDSQGPTTIQLELFPEEPSTASQGESRDEPTSRDALEEFADYDSVEAETIGEAFWDRKETQALGLPSQDTLDEEGHESSRSPKERLADGLSLSAKVEAIVFASPKPLRTNEILEILQDPTQAEGDIEEVLDQLVSFYEERAGGLRLHYLKRLGYQFQTAEAAGLIMERMFASRPRPISRAALETLAIIAYRQPVTRAEVEFIRGVDAGSIFKTLLERDLIKCVGRKEIVGRPMVFGTTEEFLKVFNLSSVKDLPPLEAFQPSRDMVRDATERLEEGESQVDVEEYIAENSAAGYESDASDGEWDDAPPEEGAVPVKQRIEGATAQGSDASASSEQEDWDQAPTESDHGIDPHSEMAVPDGPSLPPRSGELD